MHQIVKVPLVTMRLDVDRSEGDSLITHDKLSFKLCKGVHRVANTWLVVSRGIGFTGVPFRLFCPAEIIEITLTRG